MVLVYMGIILHVTLSDFDNIAQLDVSYLNNNIYIYIKKKLHSCTPLLSSRIVYYII